MDTTPPEDDMPREDVPPHTDEEIGAEIDAELEAQAETEAQTEPSVRDNVLPNEMPHNVDAEQALLGALLLDNGSWEQVADFLNDKHFYDPVHQRIYELILKLIEKGNLASPVTLKTYLESDEGLAEVGGVSYLARLASNATTLANAKEYGRVIYDLALRRELILVGEQMASDAFAAKIEENPQAQIEKAEAALYNLAESGPASSGFMEFGVAINGAVEMAERAYLSDSKLSGLDTGFADLNQFLGGFQPSDLVILAGRPAMGKTALATNMAYHIANEYAKAELAGEYVEDEDGVRTPSKGGIVGFFSLEMSAEQLAMRLLVDHADIDSNAIRQGEINEEEFLRVSEVAQRLRELPLFIDHTGAIPLATLIARARRLKRQHGLDLLVVDYLQLIRSSGRSDGRVQEVSEITQGLKALAKELNIPVVALSQLSRQVESRDDKRPQLADLRDSGAIEQDADVVMFVFRESYYLMREKPEEGTDAFLAWQEKMDVKDGLAEIIIGKNRHGAAGTVNTQFEGRRTRFTSLAKDDRLPANFTYEKYSDDDDSSAGGADDNDEVAYADDDDNDYIPEGDDLE